MQCGPFAKPDLNDSFIVSLAFVISTAVLSLALSTDIAVRNRTENQLRQRALETEVYGKPLFRSPKATSTVACP